MVTLQVVQPRKFTIWSPPDGHAAIPSFAEKPNNVLSVVIIDRKELELLNSRDALLQVKALLIDLETRRQPATSAETIRNTKDAATPLVSQPPALDSPVISAGQTGNSALPTRINLNPSVVLGHPIKQLLTLNPNSIEGRELFAPEGIAVDNTASPPTLYVSDTRNNRVLAWRNSAQFQNGAPADLVIGQRDMFSTFPGGPGTTFTVGLSNPTGLAVRDHNLYVIDSGNNRIVRFPQPFAAQPVFPDLVIGQPSFVTRLANSTGGVNQRGICTARDGETFRASLTFDETGNLFVTDPCNHRALRYPAASLRAGSNGMAADVVLGQPDFVTTREQLGLNSAMQSGTLHIPAGIAFDPNGRLYISDHFNRVLVYLPPFVNGMAAARIMGLPPQQSPRLPRDLPLRATMNAPEGITMIGNHPAIADANNNRILIFDPFEQWPAETPANPSPLASSVVGQLNDLTATKRNHGQLEASAVTLARPIAAVMSGKELFVADSQNNRVLVFPQKSSADTTAFGPAVRVLGQDDFPFMSPNLIEGREFRFVDQTERGILSDAGIVIDAHSTPPRLYVADTYNNRILGFRDARKARPGVPADLVIGQPDMFRALCNSPTQSSLCRPIGMAVDQRGNLWVADSGNARVLRFPTPFENGAQKPAANLVLGQANYTTRLTDPSAKTMAAPYGLALVGTQGILVSDSVHHRVLFYRGDPMLFSSGRSADGIFGQPDFVASAPGSEATNLNTPSHIAADHLGRLYVADTGNHRVLIFDNTSQSGINARPVFILTHASPTTLLQGIRAVFIDPRTQDIWVTDTGSGGRVLHYPRFEQLVVGTGADIAIPAAWPLAVAVDSEDAVYVADATNRVAIHYPRLIAVNGANLLGDRPLAPGIIALLHPVSRNFGNITLDAEQAPFPSPVPTTLGGPRALLNSLLNQPSPLPKTLADIQVSVDGVAAPIFSVAPDKIMFQLPMSAPTAGTVEVMVSGSSTGQILGVGQVLMHVASPGLFTTGSNGAQCPLGLQCLQLKASNEDGTPNSQANPASRGSVVSLYGTGQGFIVNAPPDGFALGAVSPVATDIRPRVVIGTCFVDDFACTKDPRAGVMFSGLAPTMVGVWQINVRIPLTATPNNATTVTLLYKSIASSDPQRLRTTIAIR
jgi:uncharacterized protein (TIGR03437 family)